MHIAEERSRLKSMTDQLSPTQYSECVHQQQSHSSLGGCPDTATLKKERKEQASDSFSYTDTPLSLTYIVPKPQYSSSTETFWKGVISSS